MKQSFAKKILNTIKRKPLTKLERKLQEKKRKLRIIPLKIVIS